MVVGPVAVQDENFDGEGLPGEMNIQKVDTFSDFREKFRPNQYSMVLQLCRFPMVNKHDYDILKLWTAGRETKYVNECQSRIIWHAQELVAVTEALHRLDREHNREFGNSGGLSLRGRLSIEETVFTGHSFR